ncbi:MAG: efflux RND transporter permease subunit [Planctomycetota bacterium]|nr:MAG: efflux RND transporter permease subunit [Planctomycetota bacterium]
MPPTDLAQAHAHGLAGRIAATFVTNKLTPLLVVIALLIGLWATLSLPREEEPQIQVPMIDIHVQMPGASAEEVAQRVVRPMERILWEVAGVEYLYSTASPGRALSVVRFQVGEDPESARARIVNRLESQFDRIPAGVSFPLVKPRSIDDVPVLALTFTSPELDHSALRRVAMEAATRLSAAPGSAEMTLIGGDPEQLRVTLDVERLQARGLDALAVAAALRSANAQYHSGRIVTQATGEILIDAGGFFTHVEAVAAATVGVHEGVPVALHEVAAVRLAPPDPSHYVFHHPRGGAAQPAVTLTFAKRPGTNAIAVVGNLMGRLDALRGTVIPQAVEVVIARDYAATAQEKSNELLLHMAGAIFSVALLIALMLGLREALIVFIAIPATLALTLAVFQLVGYTLNRITLFALIFSIGILVDDAIVVVENVVRHRKLPDAEKKSLARIAVEATAEVGNPSILATWAVIAAILPMAFVGGLMGPYMRPIPVGASAAMIWSTLIAFVVTPWAAAMILGRSHGAPPSAKQAAKEAKRQAKRGNRPERDDVFTRFYRWFMARLLTRPLWTWGFLGGIVGLLLLAMALVPLGWVQVKMLPFDNKSEFLVQIDLDEGTALETTARLAQDMAAALEALPELADRQIYIGTAAPFTFSGLVRHSYLRHQPHQADIQVNLLPRQQRKRQSHGVAVAARELLQPLATAAGARLTVAEVPPGPPVLQTLVAEVYGPSHDSREALAYAVEEIFRATPGVVDVQVMRTAPQQRWRWAVDQEKAALHGISVEQVARTLSLALSGEGVGLLHHHRGETPPREDIAIMVEMARAEGPHVADLLITAADGSAVPLRELLIRVSDTREDDRHYKNLEPVIYVLGDVGGQLQAPVYAIAAMQPRIDALNAAHFGGQPGSGISTWHARQPSNTQQPAIKWDGEWHITIEVFRDLGTAFAVVVVLIYLLMVSWFKSFLIPLVVMAAIPFSLVGILPGHALLGTFFSATSMIGFMAGAGIVVRNSIILVDFIHLRLAAGDSLETAVVEAGAVRFRPMLLTTLSLVVGVSFILKDPIFGGLAISLMAGEIASLLLSRMAIPVLYHQAGKRGWIARDTQA